MTVKETISLLKTAKKIVLGYGANAISFDKDDILSMEAFGDFRVDEIRGEGEGYYEVNILMRPIRKGDE